ncbi:MAG TPA: Hint domain-containing protein [Candidatus Methylomirabilis sp.]|nr:Hint domain-containing protein [Candidatus Methylomirabilis sp.]
MIKNLFIRLILIIIAVLILAVFISYNPQIPIPISPTPTPTPTPAITNTTTLGEGERDGPLLVQKIYPDHIEGLNFIEYPVSRGYGENITLYIGQSASNGCTVTLTLANIIQLQKYPPTYQAVFSKKVDTNRPCPICLSESTTIDTPNGYIFVTSIKEGDAVWTSDIHGIRQIARVLKTTKVQVKNHQMSHIVLDNGRQIYVSPNHPLADGRPIGSIAVGDIVDGAKVIMAELVPYQGNYTYDILPSGDTRTYWAGGILLRSSIRYV